jgi:preprotein translocase subunit SecD
MTDDFFVLLERQLEAAELRELNRGRALRRFVSARRFASARRWLSVPLAAVAALALLVVVLALQGGGRERQLSPAESDQVELSYWVSGNDAEQAAEVLRARLPNAAIAATVSVEARNRLTISAPTAARADVTALTQPGVLELYDYHRVVVRYPPVDAEFGSRPVTRAIAEQRAAAIPNGRVVHEQGGGDRWLVFAGSPALSNGDLASVGSGVDERTGERVVRIEFTRQGRRAFKALTRGIAHRGARRGGQFQFVVLLDDKIIAREPVNYLEAPSGLDSRVIQIHGGFTWQSARRIAAILSAGPLPAMVRRNQAGAGP